MERGLKTGAQAMLALMTTGTVLTDVDWASALGVTGTAVVISVLTSLADPVSADVAQVRGGGADVLPVVED
ncbi:holin [Actinomyces lilanjuaniae]|uniref:Holin n=1 Tax=Actinomyces lilanjuaniae TaxID=2321394 RepID=A0ABM6Z410_9ACTO|nr:holin [Actinomyces lilanjuaniae]